MDISNFIIKSVIDTNKVLLYNTLNTSLIILSENQYNKIFTDMDFSDSAIVEQLFSMGFLLEDNNKELLMLDKIRQIDINNSVQIVNIFSTNKCNAKCYYCFEKGIDKVDMTEETAVQTVSFIKDFYTDKKLQILWFGGEPLLNFQIIKKVTFMLKEYGYELTTHVTTNGSLLTKEMIVFFKEHYSRVSFQISIDDDINEKYWETKRYENLTPDNAFNTVIDNSKMLIESNIFLSIRINYLERNIDNAMKVFAHIKNIFAKYESSKLLIYLAPITLLEGCDNCGAMAKNTKDNEHHLLKLVKFHNEQGVIKTTAKDDEQKLLSSFYLSPKGSCCRAAKHKHLTISANGNLYKCNRFAKYKDEYVVGNVWNGVDKENAHYQFFMDPTIKDNDCKRCNILPICQGGCKAIRVLYSGNFVCQIKEIHSNLVRMYYDELLKKTV